MVRSTERAGAAPPVDVAVARWFYCDVLRGRQVWSNEPTGGGELWFQVGDALVTVRPDCRSGATPALLVVTDPAAVAARCWDAGFTVGVRETASGGTTLVVTDPFGRRLVLAPRGGAAAASLAPREEYG